MLKKPAILFACLAFTCLFVFGLVRLFQLRLEQGDVFPPYSSLRTDPLGTSIFYESINRIADFSARRYLEPTFKESDGRGRALLVLGMEPSSSLRFMPRPEFETVQTFVRKGGRVVIGFYPEVAQTWSSRRLRTNGVSSVTPSKKAKTGSSTNSVVSTNAVAKTNLLASTNSVSSKKQKTDDPMPFGEEHELVDLKKAWAFDFDFRDLIRNGDGKLRFPEGTPVGDNSNLPQLPIHTALYFTNLNKGWKTIYQCDKKTPVIVEREFGLGSVVLVADSYPFSNESMFKERYTSFLTWALGGEHEMIFDEAHLGVTVEPGVAALMRRYQLEGLMLSLVIVAALFVWKNSRSLVPPHTEDDSESGPMVLGRDSASGFVNLVRRGVPAADIVDLCFAEWKQSRGRTAPVSVQQWREVDELVKQQSALEPRARRPVETYRQIAEILKRRK
jgi:hypothetical protein